MHVLINLRFCTVHIVRNVHGKFGGKAQDVDNLIWKAQAAEIPFDYEEVMKDLEVTK